MDQLSKQQTSFCDNTGLVGILIGLCCLIQYIVLMIPSWMTVIIISIYILSIVSFFLLTRKSGKAPLLLLISAILLFILEAYMILSGAYSLVLLLFLIYTIVIAIWIYTSPLLKKLALHEAAIRAEKEEWQGKI